MPRACSGDQLLVHQQQLTHDFVSNFPAGSECVPEELPPIVGAKDGKDAQQRCREVGASRRDVPGRILHAHRGCFVAVVHVIPRQLQEVDFHIFRHVQRQAFGQFFHVRIGLVHFQFELQRVQQHPFSSCHLFDVFLEVGFVRELLHFVWMLPIRQRISDVDHVDEASWRLFHLAG
eukprot:scaffold2696_cov333-Pavlova_lutheri.AAC.23